MAFSPLVSRRGFLGASGALAAAIAAPRTALNQEASPPQVAAAIAELPVLSGLPRPFTNAERLLRIERARQLMAASKIDAFVLANSTTSSVYFADLRLNGGERLWALVIPAKATPFLEAGPFGKDADVLTWQEDESPSVTLGKGLASRGLASATIGLDENMKFVFAEGIRAANPHLVIVSASPITAGCRMIKDAHEVECLRLACRATLLVYRAVAQSLHPGMTTAKVHSLIDAAYKRVGFEGEASLNIDEFTAVPHGSRRQQTLRDGSILMLDDGCEVEGYTSDITRTFVLGKATDKMKSVFDLVHRAQTAAIQTARPGVPTASVDAAARKIIVDGGYGPGYTYFSHRLGHGIGMDMHEWPYLVKNNMYGYELDPHLKAGNLLSDEPGIYIRGEFGIRLEDDLLITSSGAELLTPQSPSLEDPFSGMEP